MAFITGKHVGRRTVLRGIGATVALPFLDAMVPATGGWTRTARAAALDRPRLVCIEMVHGAAGSNEWGATQNMWAPAAQGSAFDLSPSALSPLEPFRKDLTIVSQTDVRPAEAVTPPEDWRRSLPIERRVSHADASETDGELGCASGNLTGSNLRQAVRAGLAGSVHAVVHRERRPGGRLRVRLLVRLHRHDQLGVAYRAAADDQGSAHGVRPAVRRRRLHLRTRRAPSCHGQRP